MYLYLVNGVEWVRIHRVECCESVFRDNSMDGMSRWYRIELEYKMKKRSGLKLDTPVLSFSV